MHWFETVGSSNLDSNDNEILSTITSFQVVFVPDYNVSVAELLIPASELSQHIRYTGGGGQVVWVCFLFSLYHMIFL